MLDSIEISIVYTLLVLAPTNAEICYPMLKSWLDQAERRKFIVPKVLSNAISEISDIFVGRVSYAAHVGNVI